MIPTSIDGTDITGATIDGTDVQEITVDGDVVFSAAAFDIIDDFEDNSMSEYSGSSSLQITTSDVVEGSRALALNGSINQNDLNDAQTSTSGLDNYFSKGEVVSYLVRDPAGDNFPIFFWGVDGTDGYGWLNRLDLSVRRWDNNSMTGLNSGGTRLPAGNTWWYCEIEWHDGSGSEPDNTHVIKKYNLDTSVNLSEELGKGSLIEQASFVDSTHANNSGIGFSVHSTSLTNGTMFDRVLNLGPVS